MQHIVVEKPYKFVPPFRGTWWSSFIQLFQLQKIYLRRKEGVVDYECRHAERLRASIDAGHAVLMTPNHCRTADPIVLGWLNRAANCHVYAMASWHLFNQSWFNAWAIRIVGGFSVNREGVDRQAINMAIEILETAERPLIIFPEGTTSRTNDQLHSLLDGVAFIARAAAKKRARLDPPQQVVVHPIGLKYLFRGDIRQAADDVLTDIEHRLTWSPQRHLPLIDRLARVGRAVIALKEIEYFGRQFEGRLFDRMNRLINNLLEPIEREWLGAPQTGSAVLRAKVLRMKILPEMVRSNLPSAERDRRWQQLTAIQLAQQMNFYPPNYLIDYPSVDRILETLERLEEDLCDEARVHQPIKVIIEVGEAIPVSPDRDRKAEVDPLMSEIEAALQGMLGRLMFESPKFEDVLGETRTADQ